MVKAYDMISWFFIVRDFRSFNDSFLLAIYVFVAEASEIHELTSKMDYRFSTLDVVPWYHLFHLWIHFDLLNWITGPGKSITRVICFMKEHEKTLEQVINYNKFDTRKKLE